MFASGKASYRTEILIGLDLIAVFACGVLLTSQRVATTLRPLTHTDFPHAASLSEIVSRPPALYATVDATTWSRYDERQRRRLIEELGGVLLTHGYWGGVVKTPDGQIVGEWLENGGVELLGVGPGASTSGGTAPGESAPAPAPSLNEGGSAQYSRFVP